MPINNSKNRKAEIAITVFLIGIEVIIYILYFSLLNCPKNIIIAQALYHTVLICVLCLVPNFNREIEEADKKFKDYKQDIRNYPKKREKPNEK